jgi:hypothetical protein
MSKDIQAKCNTIFLTLLHFHCQQDIPSSAFIREFFETARCDCVFDMSLHRAEYARKLTNERLDRILAFKTTDEDESVAAQAAIHYHSWHESRLLKAISWQSWLYYNTVTRAERTLASLGLAGAAYGGMGAALNSFRYLKSKRQFHKIVSSNRDK